MRNHPAQTPRAVGASGRSEHFLFGGGPRGIQRNPAAFGESRAAMQTDRERQVKILGILSRVFPGETLSDMSSSVFVKLISKRAEKRQYTGLSHNGMRRLILRNPTQSGIRHTFPINHDIPFSQELFIELNV